MKTILKFTLLWGMGLGGGDILDKSTEIFETTDFDQKAVLENLQKQLYSEKLCWRIY